MNGHGIDSTLQFSAQSNADGRVHTVELRRGALVDPSMLQTRCGLPVFEVYNDHRTITCPTCAASTSEEK